MSIFVRVAPISCIALKKKQIVTSSGIFEIYEEVTSDTDRFLLTYSVVYITFVFRIHQRLIHHIRILEPII